MSDDTHDNPTGPRTPSSGDGDGATTPMPSAAMFVGEPRDEPDPKVVDDYRIIRRIGKGGMGVVYLAEKQGDDIKRQVALKLLKRGTDTDEVLSRFRLERTVLAALDHPNIAKLYDAGTDESGRPYFVMEYVQGQAIDDFADANALSIESRLILFRKVCDAVHHAHQNLVVHRDIKPQNIVVTPSGEPKLLDFGIAKLLNPDLSHAGIHTAPLLQLMTPEYASPEQVRGGLVGTSSDVYSLGVLLYELLTGHRPLRLSTRLREEIVRVVCDEPPERPSTAINRVLTHHLPDGSTREVDAATISKRRSVTPDRLRKRLAGDLDLIVLKALEKTPDRRYRSALDLAQDIERHVMGLPVEARRGVADWAYYAKKFVKRHRAGVSAAAVITLLLVGGLGATTWQWRRAEAATRDAIEARDVATSALSEAQAAREAADASAAAEAAARERAEGLFEALSGGTLAFLTEMHTEAEKLAGSMELRGLMLAQAEAFVGSLEASSEEGDDRMLRFRSLMQTKIGDLKGGARGPNQGDVAAARAHYEAALALREQMGDASPDGAIEHAGVLMKLGDAELTLGDLASAKDRYARAREVLAASGDDGSASMVHAASVSMGSAADALSREGDLDGAVALARESLRLRRGVGARIDNPRYARLVALGCARLGGFLRTRGDAGDMSEALDLSKESVAIREAEFSAAGDDPRGRARATRDLAEGLGHLARVRADLDEHEEALALWARAVDLLRASVERSPDDERMAESLAVALRGYTGALMSDGQGARAREVMEQAVGLAGALAGQAPENTKRQRFYAGALMTQSELLGLQEDWESALVAARNATDLFSGVVETDPTNAMTRMSRSWARLRIADCALRLARDEAASEALRRDRLAVAQREAVAARDELLDLDRDSKLNAPGRENLEEAKALVEQCVALGASLE